MTQPQQPGVEPAATERLLARQAEQVSSELAAQEAGWEHGFTRRSFLAGAGRGGGAARGSQRAPTKPAYAATGVSNGNPLIPIFLRGAADGLRILVPASSELGVDYLRTVRGRL